MFDELRKRVSLRIWWDKWKINYSSSLLVQFRKKLELRYWMQRWKRSKCQTHQFRKQIRESQIPNHIEHQNILHESHNMVNENGDNPRDKEVLKFDEKVDAEIHNENISTKLLTQEERTPVEEKFLVEALLIGKEDEVETASREYLTLRNSDMPRNEEMLEVNEKVDAEIHNENISTKLHTQEERTPVEEKFIVEALLIGKYEVETTSREYIKLRNSDMPRNEEMLQANEKFDDEILPAKGHTQEEVPPVEEELLQAIGKEDEIKRVSREHLVLIATQRLAYYFSLTIRRLSVQSFRGWRVQSYVSRISDKTNLRHQRS